MHRILVVEDSEFIAKAITKLCKKDNITVDHENHPENAFQRVKDNHYDAIILDLMMPGMTGKDVFSQLKQDETAAKIPVMILTAKADALKWDEELKECDRFMTKPFDIVELLRTINELVLIKK